LVRASETSPEGEVAIRAFPETRCEAIDFTEPPVDLAVFENAGRDPELAVPTEGFESACVAVENRAGGPIQFRLLVVGLEAGLPARQLGEAFEVASVGALLISESDFTPFYRFGFVEGDPAPPVALDSVDEAFGSVIEGFLRGRGLLGFIGADTLSPAESTAFLASLADPDDVGDVEVAAAWGRISELFETNLVEVRAFKYGPGLEDGTLRENAGAYVWVVAGRTSDGAITGFLVGSTET
jgi:hypothetical protein